MSQESSKRKIYRIKIVLIGLMFVFFYSAVVFRSYHLQILGNSQLNSLAESQYDTKLVERPKRGAIYDRNGDPLALDIMVSSVGIHPHQIVDKQKTYDIIKKFTKATDEELKKKFSSTKKFEWVKRRIPKDDGDKIAEAKLKGVQVMNEFRRYYPNKNLAGQVLGAVGYDAKALGGIELAYDKYLRSDVTGSMAQRDARGKLFTPLNEKEISNDIYLTIDKNVQFIAEDALKEMAKKHRVKSGFVIVSDVDSGEILAMANYPSFNPNLYWKYPQDVWKNHAIIDVFEPGSTFKTILVGSALNSGKVKANDKFYCEGGSYRIGKHTINDHGGYGWLETHRILQVSSNIGVTKIAQKIGKKTFYDFIVEMGFTKPSGLGLGGETLGVLRNYKTWMDIEFSNIAFGQGLSVNGLQMVRGYGAIANGGYLIQPSMIKKVVDVRNNILLDNSKVSKKQVMKSDAVKPLIDMLHSVTQDGGTAKQAHLEGYLSAGKTGTAQKYDFKLRSYANGEYVSSFIGFAPYDKPKIVVYVVYDTPRQNGYYGGIVAAPVFKKVADKSLKYIGIAPHAYANMDAATKNKQPVQKVAKVVKSTAPKDEAITQAQFKTLMGQRLEMISENLKAQIAPDLRGMSLSKVMEVLKPHNYRYQINGSGVVVGQEPAPGVKMNSGDEIKLKFSHQT